MSKQNFINKLLAFLDRWPWLSVLRHFVEGRELSRSLRESLLIDHEGWVMRSSEGSSNTVVEYVEAGDKDKVRFALKVCPRSCFGFRSCQTVKVWVNGTAVWLPPIARLLLRNVVRLVVLREANKVADTLGN